MTVRATSASLMFRSWEYRRRMSNAFCSSTPCSIISMPTALPISRLDSSPRRKVETSSPAATALTATLANDASTTAWPADRGLGDQAGGQLGPLVRRGQVGFDLRRLFLDRVDARSVADDAFHVVDS